jgi:precorrin-6B C5,15-methyltransferase / cobalt-precorrin-6B C5,C15-methyltransferase
LQTVGKLWVIGIGYKPLEGKSVEALLRAEGIFVSRRLHEVFVRYPQYGEVRDRVREINSIDETMRVMRTDFAGGASELVLIASGDPLFYGIGRRAIREFGADTVEIVPDLTSLQVAFSRTGVAWDDALLVSLHGGPDPVKRRRLPYKMEDLPQLLDSYDTIGVLTDKENNPAVIARTVAPSVVRYPSLILHVGERMGYDDERITSGTPEEISTMSFGDLNVVIMKRDAPDPAPAFTSIPDIAFGLHEGEISHSRGLITKDEVRAVALHSLRLPKQGILWDVGAGSGALSLEAARLCPGLRIFAVEKHAEQLGHLEKNISAFRARNITVIPDEAPSALSSLPLPDRVFVGGSGGVLPEILRALAERMDNGIVVVNAATLETLNESIQGLEKGGFEVRVSEISVARSRPIGEKHLMAALNPVFVVVGEKRAQGS